VEPRNFFLDVQNRTFVASPDSTLPVAAPAFFAEDVETIVLRFLKPTGNFTAPYEFVDYSANSVKLAIGKEAPAVLQASWTSNATTITPNVTSVVSGGSGANEVQRITFSQRPVQGSWAIQFPARSVTVSAIAANVFTAVDHALFDGQQVTLSGFTTPTGFANDASYFVTARTKDTFRIAATAGGTPLTVSVASGGGTASLGAITTGQLSYNATPSDVQAAIVASGLAIGAAPQIIVTGTAAQDYTLTFANGAANRDYANVSIVGSTLAVAPSLSANVTFNTAELRALLLAGQGNALILEVEVFNGVVRQTYRQAATVASDIITSTSPSPLPLNVANSFDLADANGNTWTISIDANGALTAAKI
jgi:hypothetical protein